MDASDVHVRMSAEYLYDILTNATIDKIEPPMLILCNKCDKDSANSVKRVRGMLERELSNIKETRASLEVTGGESHMSKRDEPLALGLAHEDFLFDKHAPMDVSFAKGSAMSGDISAVRDFALGI